MPTSGWRGRVPRRAAALLAALIAVAALLGATGCKKKAARRGPPPEVTGLAAVPSSADVIVGVDVPALIQSPIVERMIGQLLLREPALAGKWSALRELCQLEMGQVNRLMIALGPPPPGGRLGSGAMLLIATGKLSEPELVKCVRAVVGKGGGTVTVKTVEGRPLYHVQESSSAMYLAFGRADTVVLGNQEAYVNEAIGPGKKALDHPELAGWLRQADQRAPIWSVGRVADRLKTGLVKATSNMLKDGPSAYIGAVDLTAGIKAELVALMASSEDAKQLEKFVNLNLVGLSWAAQVMAAGKLVNKLETATEGSAARFSLELTMADVNHVLSALDGGGRPAQDSPPASGSGSAQSSQ